jgi:hypothetical protein
MRRIVPFTTILIAALAATLLLATVALAKPPAQLALTGVEPRTLSQSGGTLSIYGSGFTTTTIVRLVGFGLLQTTYVNDTALTAVVPPGIPAGIYDMQVSDAALSTTLPAALTVVAATSVPVAPTQQPAPPPGRPILTIRNFSVSPSRVSVGREFLVTIEVYNTGSRGAENTLVTFPGGPFLPVGETGHGVGFMHINATAVITQVMRVPGNTASGSYNLQINLSANDYEGNHYEYPQTIAVEVIGVGQGRPQLVIETAQTTPALLGPGDAFSLTLSVANRGDRTATNVLVGAASADLAAPASGSNFVAMERIGIDQVATATLPLVLGEVTQAGRLNLEIALEYADYTGSPYTARQNVGLETSTALSDRPQLLIAGYRTAPDSLSPGDVFTLTLEVTNVGGGEAQRLTLTLGGEGGSGLEPFAPLASGNVRFVPRLGAGETVEVVQQLAVDGSADPGAYALPVALAYDDTRGTRHTDSQMISLLVRRRPHLQIGFYAPVETAIVGMPFQLPIEVTNIGRTLVNVSTLEVSSPQLEITNGSIYLGPLDGGTAGSLEAMAVAQQGGVAKVLVTVHYLDDFEQPQVVTKTLTIQVEQPIVEAPTQQEGQAPQQETAWDKILRFLKGLLGLGS